MSEFKIIGADDNNKFPPRIEARFVADQVKSRDVIQWMAPDHGIISAAASGSASQSVSINAACSALSALGGGEIVFPAGYEVVIRGGLKGADNVTLRMLPGSKIRKDNASSVLFGDLNGVKNFSIIGGILDFGPRDIEDVTPRKTPVNTFRLINCENIKFEGVEFRNLAARVIDMQGTSGGTNGIIGCRNITIRNNTFDVATDTCISSFGTGAPVVGLTISGNRFKGLRKVAEPTYDADGKKTEPTWSVIYLSRAQDFDILDNTVESSADTAIMLGTGNNNFLVRGNRLKTTQVCIYLGAVDAGRISDNYCSSENDMGIHLFYVGSGTAKADVVITGNIFRDCAKPGVFAEGINGVIIASNIFKRCAFKADTFQDQYKASISIQNGGGSNPRDIVVTGNLIDRDTVVASTLYGISAVGSVSNLMVQGNMVSGTGYTNRFRYGNIASSNMYELQRDTFQSDANKRMMLPAWEVVNSNNPSNGAMTVHPNHGPIYGDGTVWRKFGTGESVGANPPVITP